MNTFEELWENGGGLHWSGILTLIRQERSRKTTKCLKQVSLVSGQDLNQESLKSRSEAQPTCCVAYRAFILFSVILTPAVYL
jgi:hypothetical protein